MRVSAHQYPVWNQSLIWRLIHVINVILKSDRFSKMEAASRDIETLLDSDPPSTSKPSIK